MEHLTLGLFLKKKMYILRFRDPYFRFDHGKSKVLDKYENNIHSEKDPPKKLYLNGVFSFSFQCLGNKTQDSHDPSCFITASSLYIPTDTAEDYVRTYVLPIKQSTNEERTSDRCHYHM